MGRFLDIANDVLQRLAESSNLSECIHTGYELNEIDELRVEHADAEFDRFFSVCVPNPDGRGVHDLSLSDAELQAIRNGDGVRPSMDSSDGVPNGWSHEGWIGHLRYMADACEYLHPNRAAEYRASADRIVVEAMQR